MLLEQGAEASKTLTNICDRIGVGPRTVQRAFQRTLSVTFQEYVGALRIQSFKSLLHSGSIVTDALYQAGYGSSSQLYTDTHSLLGMTPGEYRHGGQGLIVDYALMEYGERLVAAAAIPQGVCARFLGFSATKLKNALRQEFPNAQVSSEHGSLLERLQAALLTIGATTPVPGLPDPVQDVALRHRILKALQPSSTGVPV
jgi:AraC family transcriptional regulator of adaptative response/methylated-DNA-[protein]-cysteine methyltransferase